MKIEGPCKALVIYIGETDHWHGKPTYAAIVERARKEGMAGATVCRGIMGFGGNSRLHTASILRLSEDLPVTIQIVDTPERIDKFLPLLDEMIEGGTVMTWDVCIERYVHGQSGDQPA
jgi:PII-like signaling protein